VKVGDVYVSPRGRRYRVLRFERSHGKISDVVLSDDKNEHRAVSGLMVPENGWTLVESP
jgi:hypothetical protein